MKYIYKFFVLFLSLSFLISCNNEDDAKFTADTQSGWVQLNNGSTVNLIFGGTDEIRIPLTLRSAVNPGLTVEYNIVDIVGNSSSIITSNANSVTLENGTLVSEIVLGLSQTGLTSPIEFDVVLSSTSRDNVTVGLSDDSKPIRKKYIICPIVFASTYAGTPIASVDPDNPGPAFTATFTADPVEPNTFNVDTCWGPNYVANLTGNPAYANNFLYGAKLIVNPATGSVQIVGDTGWETGGTGSIDPCSGVITYTLTQSLFSNPFTTDVTLIPN